jgi:hypothetical protein
MAVTIAAALLAVVAAPALAQNSESAPAAAAPMKAKPKTPAGGTVTVKVTNWRAADLVELQVVGSGSVNWKKVLGALKAGQWTWAKVPQGKNCYVDLRGQDSRPGQLTRQKQIKPDQALALRVGRVVAAHAAHRRFGYRLERGLSDRNADHFGPRLGGLAPSVWLVNAGRFDPTILADAKLALDA